MKDKQSGPANSWRPRDIFIELAYALGVTPVIFGVFLLTVVAAIAGILALRAVMPT